MSLKRKYEPSFVDVLKITFILAWGIDLLKAFVSLDRIFNDMDPRNGKIIHLFFGYGKNQFFLPMDFV